MTDPQPPLARVIVRSTVWTSLGTYAGIMLGFGANLILTRLLPVATFGHYAMGAFWTAQLNLKPKSGLAYAAIQHERLDGQLLGTYWAADLALAGGSLALGGIAAAVLAWLNFPPPVILAVLALMAAEAIPALTGALHMALEKELQVSRLTLAYLLVTILAYIAGIGLALTGAGIWSLLAINLLVATLGVGGVYVVCRRRLPGVFATPWQFSRALARQLFARGLPTGLSLTALAAFVTNYDNFLVGTFAGYEVLGLYDRAYRTAQWPNLLLATVIGRIGFLVFARVIDDPPRLLHAVRLSLWALLTFGIPAALFLAFGAPDIISLLYGERWLQSALYLRFIVGFTLAGLFSTLAFWLAVASKNRRATLILTLSQALTLLVAGTLLAWRWGVAGVLVGVGLTMLVATVTSAVYIFRRVPLSPRAEVLPALAAAALAAAGLWGLTALPGWGAWPTAARVGVMGLAAGGLFLGSLFLIQPALFRERLVYFWRAWRRP
jgi:lipopolysaccharide exporter